METYQSCGREYGPVEEDGFHLAVYIEKIVPIRPLLNGLSEAFADPLTDIGADLMDIDPNDINGAYYEKCAKHLQDVMRNEQRENETAQQKALEKYSELDTPFFIFILEFLKMPLIILSFIFCSLLFCAWQSQYLLSLENIKRAVTASCEPPNTGINN